MTSASDDHPGAEGGVRKPRTVIFQRALTRLEVEPVEAVFVGDHPQVDVEGARRAELWAIWKRDPYWGECPHAHAVVDDLLSLPRVIRSLADGPPGARDPARSPQLLGPSCERS